MAYPVPIKSIKSNDEKKKKKHVPLHGSVIGCIREISVTNCGQVHSDYPNASKYVDFYENMYRVKKKSV